KCFCPNLGAYRQVVKVVTINILFEMEKWAQRRELLVEGLAAQQADLIGLQEVKLPEDNSAWLAQQLNMPYVQLVPYKQLDDKGLPYYGGAILSRYPFTQQDSLDLQTQGRVAQYVQVEVDGCTQEIKFLTNRAGKPDFVVLGERNKVLSCVYCSSSSETLITGNKVFNCPLS
ncbi:MAG: endonuclease/exonuclease/phosphatase family protein, partial [Coleofasciculus sp. S288]|nr:endonuclease/exonuclease/phosphatase family protein [Coleofasciculus sp. S288]